MSDSAFPPSMAYQGAVMLLVGVAFLVIWTRGCKREILQELRQPLLHEESPEHRIDAATREAEAGYSLCTGCGFENFKRFTHCTLCGDKLPPVAGANESEHEAIATTPRPLLTPTHALTTRQRRARKRKEWTRTLTADGSSAYWVRSSVEKGLVSSTAVQAMPGFVVQFKKETEEQEEERGVETIENVLLHEVSERDLVLVPAAEANGAVFPDGFELANVDRLGEVVRIAAEDFPTKYAHFVVSTAALFVPAEVEFLKLSLHREYILEESVDHLCCIQEKNIRSFMRINFLDESAVDAGGVHREWLMIVNDLLAESKLNLFVCHNKQDQSYFLNPNSLQDVGEEHLKYYFATGRLVGRVLLEGTVWGFHLSLPLLKMVLGQPVSFADLEYFDPEAFKNLLWLLDNHGVESLGLDFSVCEKMGDEMVIVDLIPDGRNIAVTDENKMLYLERKFKYTLFESISSQLYAFLKGVYEVIPQELLMLYDVEEFDYLLCGSGEIDVEDWKTNSTNSLNLDGTRVMRWFWDEVAIMPNEYRRRLLLFATGSSRVPLSGFRGLTSYDGRLCPFTLKGVSYHTNKYISSHSCFNRLDLPLYKSRDELKTVLYAILDGDIYGFTTA